MGLSGSLKEIGIELGRLKTGLREASPTIDRFYQTLPQHGDEQFLTLATGRPVVPRGTSHMVPLTLLPRIASILQGSI